jgi:hypothetical protein
MKQFNKNRDSVIQRNLDEALLVNPIEDGNMPVDDPLQGFVYTSEIDNSDYDYAYKGIVNSIFSSETRTGNNDFYQLEVSYTGVDESVSTSAWFGNNLINAGDAFVLQPLPATLTYFNYVKGSVINVIDMIEDNTFFPNITYTYTLICSIAEGLTENMPQGIDPNIEFLTNRRVFSTNQNAAPVNLISAVNKSTNTINFYWDDITEKAISYRLNIRSADNSSLFTYDVYGSSPDFKGVLKPYVRNTKLRSVKIIDQGSKWSMSTEEVNVLVGKLPTVAPIVRIHNDGYGKARISKWQFVNRISHSSPTAISIRVKPLGNTTMYNSSFVDMNDDKDRVSYVTSNSGSSLLRQITIAFPDGNPYASLTTVQFNALFFNKVLDIHTGAQVVTNPLTNLNIKKDPIFEYDKYPANTKWILPMIAPFTAGTSWYWSVAAIQDNDKKIFSEWSQEELLIIS